MFNINCDDEQQSDNASDNASETTLGNLYNEAVMTFEDFGLDSIENLQTFDAIYQAADYDTALALGLIIRDLSGRCNVTLSQNIWNNIVNYNNLQSLSAVLYGLIEEDALTDENLGAIFANPDAASNLNNAYFDTNERGEPFLPEFRRIIATNRNTNMVQNDDLSDAIIRCNI